MSLSESLNNRYEQDLSCFIKNNPKISQSESLRQRYKQHKPKNIISKNEDKNVAIAAKKVIEYLKDRVNNLNTDENSNIRYDLTYCTTIKIGDMIKFITRKNVRKWEDFDHTFDDRQIQPDGGVIYLEKNKINKVVKPDGTTDIQIENIEKLPLVIAEVKHQGTNDKLLDEGKKMQAFGNAIERLGKNLIGIRAMMHYEDITPFICFGDGCDFANPNEIEEIINKYKDRDDIDLNIIRNKFQGGTTTVRAKIYVLNDFYNLNKVIVFKKDPQLENGKYSPVSMMFRYKPWTVDDMYEHMKEIAETSFRYYTQ